MKLNVDIKENVVVDNNNDINLNITLKLNHTFRAFVLTNTSLQYTNGLFLFVNPR